MDNTKARKLTIIVSYLRVIQETPNAALFPKSYLYELTGKMSHYSPAYVGNVVRASVSKHPDLMDEAKRILNKEKQLSY